MYMCYITILLQVQKGGHISGPDSIELNITKLKI